MNRKGLQKSFGWMLFAFFCFAFLGSTNNAYAQPDLTLKRVVNNWPTIELYFTVSCDGDPQYFFNKEQHFKVWENGVEIGEFTLWCPDPRQRCAISVSLVFDASGSMGGAGNAGAKAAGHGFVNLMDGIQDEAAIIWFHSSVNVELSMTTNLMSLHNAVDALPASGATAVWDGIYAGVQELISGGSNPCRAVIAMTDGGDNSSTRTPPEIIALANRNRIRVFTIGLGNGVQEAQLQTIADLTGGRYYRSPSPDQLVSIYEEISTIIFKGFLECVITYQAKCMDGGIRNVELWLTNFCSGFDSDSKTYRAPKDTSTYKPLEIEIAKREGKGGTEVTVPIELNTPIVPEDFFFSGTFTVQFDPACVQFKNIKTNPGYILHGQPILVNPLAGGVEFRYEETVRWQGTGTIAELTFVLSDPDDTTCCDIELTSWVFDGGCFKPVLKPGEICIIPRQPLVQCGISGVPQQLVYVRSAKDYQPNPFDLQAFVVNTGDKEATNARFKIDFDAADFQLISPVSNLQNGNPKDVPHPSSGMDPKSSATWKLKALPRITGDTVEICVTASFDNHPDVTCCIPIYIPPTEPILECDITAPTITADNDNQRYIPMPFDLTVNIRNRGGMKTDTVFATIIVPPDLQLAGADAPDNHTKIASPMFLLPNGSGTVTWQLKHPVTITPKEYFIEVWVKTSNADSSVCQYRIEIPPLQAPSLQASCFVPDELDLDVSTGIYGNNPFDVTLRIANVGGMDAENVSAFIYIPADVVLVSATDANGNDIPGIDASDPRIDIGTVPEFRPGDTPFEVTWTFRYDDLLRRDRVLDWQFAVAGISPPPTSIPTDTAKAYCETFVPGLPPAFECEINAPDHLVLNGPKSDVTPNPFVFEYTVRNTSSQTAAIQYVEVFFNQADDIRLVNPGTERQIINVTLGPGQETTVSWDFRVINRITARNAVQIYAIAVDDENNPIQCNHRMRIDPLETALTCATTPTPARLTYDPILRAYSDQFVELETELLNAGGFNLTDVTAVVTINDVSGLGLLEFNPAYTPPAGSPAGNDPQKVIPLLFVGQQKSIFWGLRLANPNNSGNPVTVEVNVDYWSNETPQIVGGCNTYVTIDPVVTPSLTCDLMAPDSIFFNVNRYEPTPFNVQLRVDNIGNGTAHNVKAYVLQDTRFNIEDGTASIIGLGSIPPADFIDFGGNGGFFLEVNARQTDGYDTVRVVVVADGIPPAVCEIPIYVQKELGPVFEMTCVANPDVLSFNESINDYVPNPFDVEVTVTNVGTARATDCKMIFVGPTRFTPAGQVSEQYIGDMEIGQTFTFVWKMRALLRDVASTDPMQFQVHGRGGLGEVIKVGECLSPITVPPAEAAEYEMVCEAPDALVFDGGTGRYIPDPFTFRVTVTNTGQALGKNIEVTPNLHTRLTLETTPKVQVIPQLNAGESAVVEWFVRPITQFYPDTAFLCADLVDEYNTRANCCTETFIPAATKTALGLTCSPEFPELTVDVQKGAYAESPFRVFLTVENTSQRVAKNVTARLVAVDQNDVFKVLNDPPYTVIQTIADELMPGATSRQFIWKVAADPRRDDGYVELRFIVSADDISQSVCNVEVFVPRIGRPVLDCQVLFEPNDLYSDGEINFDDNIGDYEGEKSQQGNYNVFRVKVPVQNVGEAQANDVIVTLIPPEGVTIDDPDGAISRTEPRDIPVQGIGYAEFDVRVIRQSADAMRNFSAKTSSRNADLIYCDSDIFIEGAPKVVDLTIPNDPVGQYGSKVFVPVYITPTIGKNVNTYRMNVQFDPTVVRFLYATNENTQTQFGWIGPRHEMLMSNPASGVEDIVRIQDYTTGSTLNSKSEGVLVYLVFEGIFGSGDEELDYAQSNLRFVEDLMVGGDSYKTSMNSNRDDEFGEVSLNLTSGMITISGECIVPLNSSLKFELAQNSPNPFNPTTTIDYQIGVDTHVEIVVFDALGQEVATLVDEQQTAGEHSVIFDAASLPSGTYIYKLQTEQFTEMKRMVLTR